jgi:hypothetical protein
LWGLISQADWQYSSLGKTFNTFGALQKGDVLEFNAAIEGSNLKRPTKAIVVKLAKRVTQHSPIPSEEF